MLSRSKARVSRACLARPRVAALATAIEELEGRLLLSTVPNTTPLHTGLDTLVITATDVVSEANALHDKVFGALDNLPLVGSALKNAAGGASDALNTLSTDIKSALNAMSGTITGVTIQNAIFAALGPSGLKVLPSSVATASDVPITLEDTDGNVANGAEQVDLNLDIKGNLFTATLNPSFKLGLPGLGLKVNGQIQAQVSYDIKLNIDANATDGLYVDLSPNPEATLKLAITAPGLTAKGNLGFLQLNASDGTPDPSPTQFTQLIGTISTDLSVGGADKLTPATIGSLVSNSSLSANAEADVHLHNVLSFGGSAEFPSLQADLDITWTLASASLDSGGVTDSSFGSEPDITFNNVKLDLGSFFGKFVSPIVDEIKTILHPLQPLVDLLNTRMPVFSDIGFLENKFDTHHDGKVSLLEVIDFLSNGAGAAKFLDTLVAVDNFANSIPTGIPGDTLLSLGSFDLGGSSNTNGADVRGLPDLSNINLTSFNAADITTELTNIGNSIGGSVGGQIGGFLGTLANGQFGGAGGGDGGGLHFPLLENPASAFKLLLGQNVDLFTFDTPTLDLSAKLDEFFSILGPLGIELRGTLHPDDTFAEATAHLSMGYDTQGLKEFATTDNFSPSKLGDLFDGFYVVDDPSKTYANASLSVGAFAALNVVVASAGVGGSIGGSVNFTANDPDSDGLGADGKLRPKEVISDLQMSPLCLFDITGKVTASLSAFVKVGFDTPFGFVGWEKDFNLGSSTIADFSAGCTSMPANPPVLATVLGDGTLRLNMGPYAADRVNGDVTDGNESFTVTPVSTQSDGTETVIVTAFNYVQTYTGVTKIYGEGGNGDDTITLAPGVTSPAELWGDFNPGNPDNGGASASGNDTLGASDGAATLHGGGGDDQLTAGIGSATMYGDAGKDLLIGGPASDSLDGGDDNDSVYGMGGNDTLLGGAGDDYLDGGDGNDSIDGGDGNDHLIGGPGDDSLTGGNSDDILEGNIGNDSMDGGSGNDLLLADDSSIVYTGTSYNISLLGGGGNDTMAGSDGNDSMYGQDGNDSMSGGTGNDYMQGNAGDDTMDGGDNNDSMIGGQGSDSTTGGSGNDVMLGDDGNIDQNGVVTLFNAPTDGNDTMTGNDGNDSMYGQGGNDSMLGNAGNDLMSGGDGLDVMLGDDGTIFTPVNRAPCAVPESTAIARDVCLNSCRTDGNDTMNGGAGNDTMYGEGGNDWMDGNAGDDYMEGNTGADTMYGEAGDDDMIGGSSSWWTPDSSDLMDGGDGNDVMLGDNGSITRPTDRTQTHYLRNTPGATPGAGIGLEDNAVIRCVVTFDSFGACGNDTMYGGTGDDIMHGQDGNDVMSGGDGNDQMLGEDGNDSMDGGTGNDCLLGDSGIIVASINNGKCQTTLAVPANKLSAAINVKGTINWCVRLISCNGGNDTMMGGLGDDVLHTGPGNDIALGDSGTVSAKGVVALTPGGGNDALFGDSGCDRMYGGDGSDHLYGGVGGDYLDGSAGVDTVFGGPGQDTLVADTKDDRLIDWYGNSNTYIVPPNGNGAPTIIRSPSPLVQDFLLDLAAADGSADADDELGIPFYY